MDTPSASPGSDGDFATREIIRRATYDAAERTFTFAVHQDVEDIIERNKALRKQEQRSDWARHKGTIPNVILLRWLNEEHERGNVSLQLYTEEFDQLVGRKLDDPEWAYLRTDASFNGVMGFGS